MRALARGSFYALGGFSLFCLAVWKLSGVTSVSCTVDCLQYMSESFQNIGKNLPYYLCKILEYCFKKLIIWDAS